MMRSYLISVLIFSTLILHTFSTKSFNFFKTSDQKVQVLYNLPEENAVATVSKETQPYEVFYTPDAGESFIGFREAIGFKESRGKYDIVNIYGYLGKYQFGKTTLRRLNIHDTNKFLKDPKLQEEAFVALLQINKYNLRKDIEKNVGKKINGIEITESGILAAAHLVGAGGVKKYLRSNGAIKSKDAFGTTIQYYLKKFSGYDTSVIKPDLNPKVNS